MQPKNTKLDDLLKMTQKHRKREKIG